MMFHGNRLLADDSHEISCLIFSKIRNKFTKFVVCCSLIGALRVKPKSQLQLIAFMIFLEGGEGGFLELLIKKHIYIYRYHAASKRVN